MQKIVLSSKEVDLRSYGESCVIWASYRVPTRPGKPGKMRVHLENLYWNFDMEKCNKCTKIETIQNSLNFKLQKIIFFVQMPI